MKDSRPPPKPKPSPPRLINALGKPVDKPMPEWKVKLICFGLAVLAAGFVMMVGLFWLEYLFKE